MADDLGDSLPRRTRERRRRPRLPVLTSLNSCRVMLDKLRFKRKQ